MKTTQFFVVIALMMTCTFAGAVDLPVTTDFNSDVVGLPPAVGGPNQPSTIFETPGTSATVQASAFGLSDQPVVLDSPNDGYVSVDWVFPEISAGTVRIEVTVAADSLFDGYFIQTASADDLVGARLRFHLSGEIDDQGSGTVVGIYTPNSPFRVRLDVRPADDGYCATIDDEMDGFANDPEYCGLPFLNTGVLLPIAVFYGSLHPADFTQAAIAYDDLLIETAEIFADGFESGSIVSWM